MMDWLLFIGDAILLILLMTCAALAIRTAQEIMRDLYEPNDEKKEKDEEGLHR